MNAKERLFLTGLLGIYLAPVLDKLAVPPKDQTEAIGYIIIGIPLAYHVVAESVGKFLSVYGPRIRAQTLDKWFPPLPVAPPALAPKLSPTDLAAIVRVTAAEVQKSAAGGAPTNPIQAAVKTPQS